MAELPGGEWAALPGWSPGAFKVGARERCWLGWLPERQLRRLHLIASNTRVLGLWAKCLSSDMEALRGHPVLLAETFVDPAMFAGTCYLAAGWTEIGETRGFSREAGGWREHGRPKKVLVRPLRPSSAKALGGLDDPEVWSCGEAEPPKADRLRSQ